VRKAHALFVFLSLAILILDQFSKVLVLRLLPIHSSVPVISGFFNLAHVRNRGMAFGLMNRPGTVTAYLLTAATIGAIILILVWFWRLKEEGLRTTVGLALILGGAAGNLIDRIRLGEVVDFFDCYIGPYHWPVFNVADSAITVGTLWLALVFIFHPPGTRHGPEKGREGHVP